jgi:hypothetical protein
MNAGSRFAVALGVILVAFNSLCEAASDLLPVAEYVGLRNPERALSGNGTLLTVYLISPVDGQDYAVRFMRLKAQRVLLLERLERDASGQPSSSQVVAAAKAPQIPRGFALALGVCYREDVRDPDIIALAKKEENRPTWRNITAAWRADIAQRKFTAVDPRGMECENADYGKD